MTISEKIIKAYATAIQRAAWSPEWWPKYFGGGPVMLQKQRLRDRARKAGLVKWRRYNCRKTANVGFLAGIPGHLLFLATEALDITYLVAVTGQGCYGVGHIANRTVDYDNDIPLILALWSGGAKAATAATVVQIAADLSRPTIIQLAAPGAVHISGYAVTTITQYFIGQTATKFLEKLTPKFAAKVATKLASKTLGFMIPVVGGIVSYAINTWVCNGIMEAAEKYYSADFVVFDSSAI